MTKRRDDAGMPDRYSAELPLDRLQYTITPSLVRCVAFAHRFAGEISAMRFSFYALKRLETEATHARIAELCTSAGQRVQPEEVIHVLAGDILPPRRRRAQDTIRRAAILADAVGGYKASLEVSTANDCAAYLDLAASAGKAGITSWSKFAGRERARLFELHQRSVTPDTKIVRLYERLAADNLLSCEPLLRAGVLYWVLADMPIGEPQRMGVDAVVAHELRAGGFDPHGLFVLKEYKHGHTALRMQRGVDFSTKAVLSGDITGVLEHFASYVGLALGECAKRLRRRQDAEDRLPWLMVRPPDEVDRAIFEAVEKHGSATSPTILGVLPEPRPPLRTLQRRLQNLVRDGLLVKHGGRKDAFYRVAERI